MQRTGLRFPTTVNLVLITSVLMLAPLAHAIWQEDWRAARAFFYSGALSAVIAVMVGLALAARAAPASSTAVLVRLLLAYALLPAVMAAPVSLLVPSISYGQAYFEMMSSLTTTGATVLSDVATVPESVHLWRAICGWAGGLLILVVAVAILEPMKLGGFELEAAIAPGRSLRRQSLGGGGTGERLWHHARNVAPVYAALTAVLTFGLLLAGDRLLVALSHAMSVMSTSAITPLESLSEAKSGYAGEVLIFLFLLLALSRNSIQLSRSESGRGPLRDPEYRLAAVIVLSVSGLLFARHFFGAVDVEEQGNLRAAATALWGGLFNVLSFLSTTGFESRDWAEARDWSGLETPGLILLLLCLVGGGVATTAGGVKLLRVYALYKHGVREMQRLIHPNSVGGAGITARRIRREGALIAWVFLMMFLLGMSLLLLVLTALGQNFDDALALSVAALSNTGPAAQLLNPEFSYTALDPATRAVLSVAMVFGRVEVLVFVSLLNPDFWRR
ncbi:TrkH family potassium uptake protein [Rhodobacteraceae bacterium 2CG4]|uniref:TrkH family potassium uptake protein n=1 Tax=Halovulum marinum TaxID=2662447 RepID=A0A6L5Z5U1_9RHOB|nr:potassium transporter TrkG [Halovulum marinum]MSU91414.1 TrkH family potassium uptake protein [Halovulum marinum]